VRPEEGHPRLAEFDTRGQMIPQWGPQDIEGMRHPKELAVAPDGIIYLTDFSTLDE
jgi:hypothetical protein